MTNSPDGLVTWKALLALDKFKHIPSIQEIIDNPYAPHDAYRASELKENREVVLGDDYILNEWEAYFEYFKNKEITVDKIDSISEAENIIEANNADIIVILAAQYLIANLYCNVEIALRIIGYLRGRGQNINDWKRLALIQAIIMQ